MGNTASFINKKTKKVFKTGRSKKQLPSVAESTDESGRDSLTVVEESEAIRVIKEWTVRWAAQDLKGAQALASPDCSIYFKDAEADMLFSDFVDNMGSLMESFPDYTFTWGDIIETEPGEVHLYDYQSTLTHTGKPYSFGGYDPIEAKGTVVKDHIPHIIYKVQGGIVTNMEILAEGKIVGLPGIYLAIGGVIF